MRIREQRWRQVFIAFYSWREIADSFSRKLKKIATRRGFNFIRESIKERIFFRSKLEALQSRTSLNHETGLISSIYKTWRKAQVETEMKEISLRERIQGLRLSAKTEKYKWLHRSGYSGKQTLETFDSFSKWRGVFKRNQKLTKTANRVKYLVEGRILFRVLDLWCRALPPLRADTLQRRRLVRQLSCSRPLAPIVPNLTPRKTTPKSSTFSSPMLSSLKRRN